MEQIAEDTWIDGDGFGYWADREEHPDRELVEGKADQDRDNAVGEADRMADQLDNWEAEVDAAAERIEARKAQRTDDQADEL